MNDHVCFHRFTMDNEKRPKIASITPSNIITGVVERQGRIVPTVEQQNATGMAGCTTPQSGVPKMLELDTPVIGSQGGSTGEVGNSEAEQVEVEGLEEENIVGEDGEGRGRGTEKGRGRRPVIRVSELSYPLGRPLHI